MNASSNGLGGPDMSLLQAMFNATDAAVVAVDDAGVVVVFNSAAELLFERPAADVIGAAPSALFAEGSSAEIQSTTWTRAPGQHSAVIRHGDRAGAPVDASVARTTAGERDVFVVTLRPSVSVGIGSAPQTLPHALFRSIADAMPDAIVIVQNGQRTYVNDAYLHMFGYRTLGEALAAPRHERWVAEDAVERDSEQSPREELRPHRIIRPNGEVRLVEGVRAELMFEGQPAVGIVLRDVTEREGALRGSSVEEARLWPMFEHLQVGVAIVGRDRTIIEANPALAAMVKSTPAGLRGSLFPKSFPSTSQIAGRDGRWEKLVAGELDFLQSERKVTAPGLDIDWVRVSVFAVRNDQGEFRHSIHTVEDITDRKMAESQREVSDALWWQTFEQSHLGMALVSADRNIVEANPSLAAMVGQTPSDLRGTWFGRFFPPPRLSRQDNTWDQLVSGELSSFENERPVIADGATVEWVSISTSAVRDPSGEFLYGVRLVQDISERKRAERALLEREAHFRSLFEAGTDGIVLINRERRNTDVNPGFERLLGYSAGELIGAGIGDYFSPNAEPPDPTKVDAVLRGELASYEHETLFTRKDGSEVWALGVVSPVRDAAGNVQFGMVTLLDITLRKRAEEELRASEAQFRSLFEDAPTAIAMMDAESGFFAGNPAWEFMFGYSAAEMKGYRSTDFLSPNHARQSAGQLDRLLKGELPFIEGEWLYRRKDGSDVWASGRVSAVSDTTGGTSYVLFMLQDITERKLAEQELQESQSRFVATIEQAPVGIAIVGLDRMILQVNPLFCELLGQKAEALVGQGFRSYFAPATTGQGVDAWSQLLAGQVDSYVQERTLIDPPPGVEWLSISTSMVRDDQGAALFAVRIASDVTERKRAEQELRDNAERLRAVFESGPFGLAIIDADTRVRDVNGWLPSMFGYTREEMIGKRMEEFVDPAHVRRNTRDSRRLVSGEQDRLTTDRIYQRKDGSKFPAIVSTSAVRDEQGTYRYSVRAIQDITERVSAETAGRDSEARFRSLFEAAPQGMVLKDANDLIVEVNHALEVFLGRAAEDLRGHRVRDYVSPSDYPRNDHDYARLVTGEISTIEIERVFIRPDGSEVWGAISQSAVRDSSGAFAFGVMTIEDVTVRHRQEQEIREREAWFRAVFESGPLGLALIDAETRITEVNQPLQEMFGYARDEMIGKTLAEFNDPDYTRSGRRESQVLVTGKTDRIVTNRRYQRNDGTTFPAVVTTAAVRDDNGEFRFAVRAIQDVTESTQSRADLEQSERRFRAVFEGAPLGIALVLPGQAEMFDVNAEMEAMFGYSREDLLGHRLREFWIEPPSPEEAAISEEVALGARDRSAGLRMYRRQDGTPFHAAATSAAIRDENGSYLYGVRIIQDITDQIRAQSDLFESESRFRAVFENAPLGFAIVDDVDASIIGMNVELSALFGYSREEMIGHRLVEFRTEPPEIIDSRQSQAVASGEVSRVSVERLYRRKNGTEFHALVNTAAVRDNQGRYLYSLRTVTDITERKQVEINKDEFIAVTSHELRTPVTAMHAAVTLVAQGAFGPLPEKAQSMLDIAKSNSDRLVALVNDLIDLERLNLGKVTISPVLINAGEIAHQAADLVQPLATASGIVVNVEPDDVTVMVDPGRLLQTLQNLLSNAIKFSPPGSTVAVRVSHDDAHVAFHIQDHGKGIPADQLERIFDRFQQVDSSDTRGALGTGLGLAIAKSIVERHGGRIWVESELGAGSTFIVELPKS